MCSGENLPDLSKANLSSMGTNWDCVAVAFSLKSARANDQAPLPVHPPGTEGLAPYLLVKSESVISKDQIRVTKLPNIGETIRAPNVVPALWGKAVNSG